MDQIILRVVEIGSRAFAWGMILAAAALLVWEIAERLKRRNKMTEGNQEEKVKAMMNEAKISLTVEQAADRVLAVLCAMTKGDPQVLIRKEDLMAECRRVGILWMSEFEFAEYLQKTQQTLGAYNN